MCHDGYKEETGKRGTEDPRRMLETEIKYSAYPKPKIALVSAAYMAEEELSLLRCRET